MSGRNIVLTGIPRSGTTLACHLLNKLPGLVALNEPLDPSGFAGLDIEQVTHRVQHFLAEQRESILEIGTAESRSVAGAVPDNFMGDVDRETGTRRRAPLGRRFDLAVMHNALFTAMLAEMV